VYYRLSHKKHRENSQDDKNESKEVNKWAAARGESDLALKGSRRGRKNTFVRTRRMNVQTNQPYLPDNQKNRQDIQDHRLDVSHKKSEKERKKSRKIFPN
jgi:hypothetical protein